MSHLRKGHPKRHPHGVHPRENMTDNYGRLKDIGSGGLFHLKTILTTDFKPVGSSVDELQ